MAKEKRNLSAPTKGMNTDVHPSKLSKESYVYMLNGNYEDETGAGIPLLQNEHSNILCHQFDAGFKVIGTAQDITNNRTFFFLTNPDTGESEIGIIPNINNFTDLEDVERECDCKLFVDLADPLETIPQEPACTYESLIKDYDCSDNLASGQVSSTTPNLCLNFDINYPIDTEIKQDKCGTIIYFTDDLNPRRKIEVDRIDQYFEDEVPCEDDDADCDCGLKTVPICINCEKLLLQKPFKTPCLKFDSLIDGGNLKHGVYSFYIAYTDANGNEMTRYMSVTGEIPIKDPNRNIYQPNQLDLETNYSIKLSISNIDYDFTHFKVAVKQINSIDGTASYFSAGVYPITTEEIIYSSETNQQRISLDQLAADYPIYTTAKNVESSNNMLFFSDLETIEDPNLQPVVNLMGQFAKWRTSVAEEDLYNNAIGSANYRSYLRDEVIPHSIRFITRSGYTTPLYPLIPRAKEDEQDVLFEPGTYTLQEQIDIIDNDDPDDVEDKGILQQYDAYAAGNYDAFSVSQWKKDVLSTLVNGNSECSSANRYEKWQYYNTARVTNSDLLTNLSCASFDKEDIINNKELTVERSCSVSHTQTISGKEEWVFTEFDEGEDFTTIEEYIRKHQGYIEDENIDCRLVFSNYECEDLSDTGNDCDCSDISAPDCCEPYFSGDCEGGCKDNNGNPKPCFQNSFLKLVSVTCTNSSGNSVSCEEDSRVEVNYEPCNDFTINSPPDFCNIYERDRDGDVKNANLCFDHDGEDDTCNCSQNKCYPLGCYIGVDSDNSGTDLVAAREDSVSGAGTCKGAKQILLDSDNQLPSHIIPFYDTDGDLKSGSPADDNACTASIKHIRSKGCDLNNSDGTFNNITKQGFKDQVHSNALWYKHQIDGNDPYYILNISEMTTTDSDDADCLAYADVLRVSILDGCAKLIETYCTSNVRDGLLVCINDSDSSKTNFPIYDPGNSDSEFQDGDEMYIAIDTPYVEVTVGGNDPDGNSCGASQYLTPTEGCFSVNMYTPNILSVKYTVPTGGKLNLNFKKICTYTSDCLVQVIDEIKCNPIPWAEGDFAYWESSINYPNNKSLYDSSTLNIPDGFFDSVNITTEFENTFVDDGTPVDGGGNYNLNSNTEFHCKPIRHFKYPDTSVAPITDGDIDVGGTNPPFKTNKIFPLGFHIDNDIINRFLDLAAHPDNNLISQEFRDEIVSYEIFKGDVRLNRSIIGKGLIYDMYKYQENPDTDEFTYFSNFPFNDLGDNDLLYQTKDREKFLTHPHNGNSNIKFTFHSPEFHFDKPNIPFELKVEAYYLGESRGKFTQVDNHPDFILLGDSAYRWATALGTLEATLNLVTDIADRLISVAQASFAGVVTNWGQVVGWVSFGLYVAQRVLSYTFMDLHQRRYEWLKLFYDNGTPYNFAAYYSSVGFYNSFKKANVDLSEGNLLRGIRARKYLGSGKYSFREDFEDVNINQFNRESSVYLSTSKEADTSLFSLAHHPTLTTYDDSRTTSEDEGLCLQQQTDKYDTNTTPEIEKHIYSPYVSLKNYIPDQYGTIDAVKWMPTGYCGRLDEDNSCDIVYGGETFLSRFYLKRKFPFFITPMIVGDNELPSLTPFSYSKQRNVAHPRYYVDFNTDQSKNFGRFEMPDIKSYFELDCYYEPKMYVKPPSKFYLYYYGIPSFIVESRINLNYRYGENNKEKDFFPNQSDYIDWTQEENVSIREDNYYFYNPIYSSDNGLYPYRILPFNYDPKEWACEFNHTDRVIYSLRDSESTAVNDFEDRWSIFLARNRYDFGNKYGRLIMLKELESERVLGLFENAAVIFNSYNKLEGEIEDISLGDGKVFSQRPTEFFRTELGYAGTQHRAFASSEFGHFWCDAKRGTVHTVKPNGEGLDEISRSGKRNWFRENLPFEIKKQFPSLPLDMADNPYKGIGILMWWDARYNRLFICKNDKRVKDEYINDVTIDKENREFIYEGGDEPIIIHPEDNKYFIDVSWTIAYSPQTESFLSFYSFKPNYAIPFNNYFQTGKNYGNSSELGTWSHLLTNKSFQVFYGKRYSWIIDLPLLNSPTKKWYEDIRFRLDARRYSNEYDFGNWDKYSFDRAYVYNNRESSGQLNLVFMEPNNFDQLIEYPKQNNQSWDILLGWDEEMYYFNTFYDIVKNPHNSPIWNNTLANDNKVLNQNAHDYRMTEKNHFRGSYGQIRLEQTKESRLKFIFQFLIESHQNYQ